MKKFKYYSYGYYEDEIYTIMVKYIREYLSEYKGEFDRDVLIAVLKFLLIQTLGYQNLSTSEMLNGPLLKSQDNGEYILCKIYETVISLYYYGICITMVLNNYVDVYQYDLDDSMVLGIYLDFMNFIARKKQIELHVTEDNIVFETLTLERVRKNDSTDYWS